MTRFGKRPEDCHAQSAVGQGIERDVTDDGQEDQRAGQKPGGFEPWCNPRAESSAKQSEEERMGKPAVSKPACVGDAEAKTDGVEIREKGENSGQHKQARWDTAPSQHHTQGENRRGMG
ncbi:MAG: hypothetical protein FWD73_11960 [Polyangiaceae bacterium]|nr:hypothetical protein [Polyangiaceae bacterium]